MRQPRVLILVLALLALFFGWRSYDEWTRPLTVAAALPQGTAAAPIGVSQAESPAPLVDLSAPVAMIVARPVFRPDRKPFSEGSSAFPQRNYDAELSKFTLLGVLQMGSDKKGIVVGKKGGAREERWEVGPGDSLPGFQVKDIGAEGVTLSADGREFLLPLYAGGPKVQAGQAPIRTDTTPKRTQVPAPQPTPAGGGGKPSPALQPVPQPLPSAAAAAPGQPGTAPVNQSPYRGRVRPSYVPGQR